MPLEELQPNHPRWLETADNLCAESTLQCDLTDLALAWRCRLAREPVSSRGALLRSLYGAWSRSLRNTTLSEENWHAYLRDWQMGTADKVSIKGSKKMCEGVRRLWKSRGGKPPGSGRAAQAAARKIKQLVRGHATQGVQRTIYKRENQKTLRETSAALMWCNENYAARKQQIFGDVKLDFFEKKEFQKRLCAELRAKPNHEKRMFPLAWPLDSSALHPSLCGVSSKCIQTSKLHSCLVEG